MKNLLLCFFTIAIWSCSESVPEAEWEETVALDSLSTEQYEDPDTLYPEPADQEWPNEEAERIIEKPEPVRQPERALWTDEQWERVSREPDYSNPHEPKTKKKKKNDHNEPDEDDLLIDDADTNWLERLLETRLIQIILFTVLIAGLLYVLVSFLSDRSAKGNRKLRHVEGYSLESLEENLEESDLDRYLRLSLEAGDFKAAVRIFYLAVIKNLHEKKMIRWKREKTNFDYVFEMRGTKHFHRFRDVTRAFELVWYGDADVNEPQYRRVEKVFRQFLNELDGRQ